MNVETIYYILLTVGVAVGGLFWIFRRARDVANWQKKNEQTEERVDEIWKFLCQRGWIRSQLSKDFDMTAATPVGRISERVREEFARDGLSAELRAWYRREMRLENWGLSEEEIMMRIQQKFGDRLSKKPNGSDLGGGVCYRLGIDSGECLVYSLVLAREEHDNRIGRRGSGSAGNPGGSSN